ncbi:archaeal flagellin N-terminal-like domain-containing protein [Ilyonectria robusta]
MIGLVATFSLGIITLAASVVRFATMQAIHAWTNVCMLLQHMEVRHSQADQR